MTAGRKRGADASPARTESKTVANHPLGAQGAYYPIAATGPIRTTGILTGILKQPRRILLRIRSATTGGPP
jgi:hypothetical protein